MCAGLVARSGGIGKTRLAVEVAWELHDGTGFADGVWFVDLASVNDPDLAPAAVARAIGIVDMGTGQDVERTCEAIRDRDMLSVLDNFEQVSPNARSSSTSSPPPAALDPRDEPPVLASSR